MKIISPKMHGMMDYVIGIALLIAPNLFGFTDVGGAAVTIPRVLGIIILGQALITKNEVGVMKMMPMSMHLMMDYLLGAFLAASPFIFGFNDAEPNAWMPHLIVGIVILAQAFMTDTA